MNPELLSEFYSLFGSNDKPPCVLFDADENEPYENPNWESLFAQYWDEIPVLEIRMNWDAFCYFTDDSLVYFIPVIIKYAIIDPRSVDMLQGRFLLALLCGSADSSTHQDIVRDRFMHAHWELILRVVTQASYKMFCEHFGMIEELERATSFLESLMSTEASSPNSSAAPAIALIRRSNFIGSFQGHPKVNCELLCEFYDVFDRGRKPPTVIFDAEKGQSRDKWDLLYEQSWDEISMFDVMTTWDAFFYFADESLTYFMPVVIKSAIIDPDLLGELQAHFLRSLLCGSSDSDDHDSIIRDSFGCDHWALILNVISQPSYFDFCERFGLLKELSGSRSFLSHLLGPE